MDEETTQHETGFRSRDGVVVRRSGRGWQVGGEQADDLISAMVLADLLADDLGFASAPPPAGPARTARPSGPVSEHDESARLAVTVAQLEHALAARVRVEQAIGVLAERHRLRPSEAFGLLRNAARSRGRKVAEIAEIVVDSTSNPLLPLPGELARKQLPLRERGLSPRHVRQAGYGEDGSAR
jgi:ANTAR domain